MLYKCSVEYGGCGAIVEEREIETVPLYEGDMESLHWSCPRCRLIERDEMDLFVSVTGGTIEEEIKAVLVHHLDSGYSIYAWRDMIFDTKWMQAKSDPSVEDYWDMGRLAELLSEYGGWLELRVNDSDGRWSQGAGRPDSTSSGYWLIPAALICDDPLIDEYDKKYGEYGYVVIAELDA